MLIPTICKCPYIFLLSIPTYVPEVGRYLRGYVYQKVLSQDIVPDTLNNNQSGVGETMCAGLVKAVSALAHNYLTW